LRLEDLHKIHFGKQDEELKAFLNVSGEVKFGHSEEDF
jgi:hypothetical protein